MDSAAIQRQGNEIYVVGRFKDESVRRFLSVVYDATEHKGYKDLILDFSRCTGAFGSSILPVCIQIIRLRGEQIDFNLKLPDHGTIKNLFLNSNWAYFIDPERWDHSTYTGHIHVPATQFVSGTDQFNAVDALVDAVLGSVADLDRSNLSAIEWALNEITDNVLVHSESSHGGLVQLTTFKKKSRHVDFVVCDSGIGIPESLRSSQHRIRDDSEALDKAIREGVTRDKSVGQGNGLFGTFQICRVSNGTFSVSSGNSLLFYNESRGLHIRREQIPFAGTVVAGRIDCEKPGLLEKALSFGGEPHIAFDFLEKRFEEEEDRIVIHLAQETRSFGSRLAGEPIRTKLANLAGIYEDKRIYVDLAEVPVMSSSFADEVFGKLFISLGPMRFMHQFQLLNLTDTVRSLIDRAIAQRSQTGI